MIIRSDQPAPLTPKTLREQLRANTAYAIGRGMLTMLLILAIAGAAVVTILVGTALLPAALANVMFWAAAHEIGAAIFDRLDLALIAQTQPRGPTSV